MLRHVVSVCLQIQPNVCNEARLHVLSARPNWRQAWKCITCKCTSQFGCIWVQVLCCTVCTSLFLVHVDFKPPVNKHSMSLMFCTRVWVAVMSKHVYRLLQGLELFSKGRQVIFLTFPSTSKRNLLYDHLISLPVVHLEKMDLPDMTQKWQSGAVSNYEYLMFLNLLAVLCVCVCVWFACVCVHVCVMVTILFLQLEWQIVVFVTSCSIR